MELLMDISKAAEFLASSILTGLGLIVLVIVILVVNNLISKYWKPVQWSYLLPEPLQQSIRFAEPHEVEKTVEPTLKK